MRFMVLIKADRNSDAGEMPDETLLTATGQYHAELVRACRNQHSACSGGRLEICR